MRTARSLPNGGGDLCPAGLCQTGDISVKRVSVRQEVTSETPVDWISCPCEQNDW